MPHGHSHGHARHGGEITRPRLYEVVGMVGFLGLRPLIYDGLVRLSGAAPGERVLDIGCGTGYFTQRAARAVGTGGKVVGIDPSPKMIEYARRHSPSNCDYQIAGAERIPEDDSSFDLAITSIAMHHIAKEQRPEAMTEIRRVLRPGGRLFIADFRSMAQPLRELLTQAGFTITGEARRFPFLHCFQTTR